jgi:hypothetical protein
MKRELTTDQGDTLVVKEGDLRFARIDLLKPAGYDVEVANEKQQGRQDTSALGADDGEW